MFVMLFSPSLPAWLSVDLLGRWTLPRRIPNRFWFGWMLRARERTAHDIPFYGISILYCKSLYSLFCSCQFFAPFVSEYTADRLGKDAIPTVVGATTVIPISASPQ